MPLGQKDYAPNLYSSQAVLGNFVAKASFSAYVLLKKRLKLGKNCTFRPKKHDQFWSSFLFLPFSLFSSKWLKYAVFAFQKAQKVGRKRGLRQFRVRPPGIECVIPE